MRDGWKAVTTPLASIFGSGFLIIVPVLAGAVGPYSLIAMAAVCALAFAVGSVIRFNIAEAEPVLAGPPHQPTLSFERMADFALIVAYVISVCLYLHILSSFVLLGLGAESAVGENLLTSAVIIAITAIGIWKGLAALAALEKWALYVTFLIIALLLGGFGLYDIEAMRSQEGLRLPEMPDRTTWEILTILGGTLIVVQGFETPRYLGKAFDAVSRIAASRLSQVISTVVYLLFVALATPIVTGLNGTYSDNSLITMTQIAAAGLVIPLVIAAALSQFSAAVADTFSAIGSIEQVSHGHVQMKWGCLLVGGGALALTWSADTLEILALASRAFAFYYTLQCFVAISVSTSLQQKAYFAAIAVVLSFITLFAVPAG